MVLCGDLDGGADTGGELGRVAVGEVYESGSAAAGADSAGDLFVIDRVLLFVGICREVAEDSEVLLGGGSGGSLKAVVSGQCQA